MWTRHYFLRLPYLLNPGVEVEIVPVAGWAAHLALYALEEGGPTHRLVAQLHLQAEGRSVHQLQDGQLAGQLEAVRLHPWSHGYRACNQIFASKIDQGL